MSLQKNDEVAVLQKYPDEWWQVRKLSTGEVGMVPSNYLAVEIKGEKGQVYLPPGWESTVDADSGERYYYNKSTGQVSFDLASLTKNGGLARGSGTMASGDLVEFKRLREEADAKLAALRQALIYQETLHLIDGEVSPRAQHHNKPSYPMATHTNSPRQKHTAHHHAAEPKTASSSNLRLDTMSLHAIAKIVDNKLEDRDDRLLGQVKALISHVGGSGAGNSSSSSSSGGGGVGRQAHAMSSSSASALPYVSAASSSSSSSATMPLFSRTPGVASAAGPSRGHSNQLSPRGGVGGGGGGGGNRPLHAHNEKRETREGKSPWVGNTKREVAATMQPLHALHATASDESSPNSKKKDEVEGIRYPQCRSLVYRPTLGTDGTGAATDDVVDSSAPTATLVLKHVHAYNGDISRHGGAIRGKNVMFISSKRIIFPAAALVVVMDIESSSQGYFSGHSEDVTCITIHPDRAIAASGQMGKDGRILIWDSSVIGPGSREFNAAVELYMNNGIRGVCGINFSGDGRFLVALGMDESHSMVVFDWATAQSVATVKMGHSDVYQMGFNPYLYAAIDRIDELKLPSSPTNNGQTATDSCCYTIVSCGGRQVKFWTLRRTLERSSDAGAHASGFKGRKIAIPKTKQAFSVKYILEGNPGVFPKQKQDTPEFMCFAVVNDEEGGTGSRRYDPPKSRIFTGASNGSVYIWQQLEDSEANRAMKTLTDYAWQPRGRLLSVVTDVHDSPVLDIDYTGVYYSSHSAEEGGAAEGELAERLVTCGKDGIANVWKLDRSGSDRTLPFEHLSTINVGYSEANVGAPRCISWDLDGCTVIVGTTGNALLHLAGEGLLGTSQLRGDELQPHVFVTPVVRAHCGKIRRIAAHPTDQVFATISTDRTIRLWNNAIRSQISLTKLADKASSIAFTPDGKALAVGNENGELIIISFGALVNLAQFPASFDDINGLPNNEKQWQIVLRKHVAAKVSKAPEASSEQQQQLQPQPASSSSSNFKKKSELSELKFSPDGEVFAVGGRDNLIHLLNVNDGYHRRAICRGHSSYIKNIDFSADGRVMQSTDAVRELLFWEVATGKKIHAPSRVRDLDWHTWTCCYGWPVQGIFNGIQGVSIDSDMNAVCRSRDGTLVVAGGSSTVNAAVKLFRFPCVAKAIPSLHGGHTSPVLDATFLADDRDVVSAGGNDSSLFIWSCVSKTL